MTNREARPGYQWCNDCQTYIDDVFVDHFDQHGNTDRLDRGPAWFLVNCAAVGIFAAFAVHFISTTL